MAEAAKGLSLRLILRAVLLWMACAAALVLCAALLFVSGALSLSAMGYASSAISFFSALIAARSAAGVQKSARLPCFLVLAPLLTLPPLFVGFLIAGELNGSAVLSTVSFTLVGCLVGILLPRVKRAKKRGGRRPKRFT